ncbi:type II toxin-antitoxin system RelE/ParE family toxin [Pseudomonas sp. NA-150]|uniref:type II toxin-antitoxin system RelE/ParE family toxin n=1 Tax=Pseudomonas sp. NA-150 TaxID=3367525 RepID=UPI0037C5E6F6
MTDSLYSIQWRTMAREDLRRIIQYIGKDSPTRAAHFGQELRNKTSLLKEYPELGRQARPGLSGCRELIVHPNYIIFYRVLSDAQTVQILRVKHAAQQMLEMR